MRASPPPTRHRDGRPACRDPLRSVRSV
jgi:hypothetical protein